MPSHKKDVMKEDGTPVMGAGGKPIKKGDRMGILPVDYKMEDKRAMEWYYDALPEPPEQDGDGGGGGGGGGEGVSGQYPGQMDSHDMWEPSDMVDQEIKQTIERIEKNRQWGNMPAELQQAIIAAQATEVPWWKILRHLLGDLMSKPYALTQRSRVRPVHSPAP